MAIARNTSYTVISAGLSTAITLLTVPLYLTLIGQERFGVLAIFWTLVGYFGLVDFGISRATAQRLARITAGDSEEDNDVFWTSLITNAGIGLLGAGAILAAAPWLIGLLDFSASAVRGELQASIFVIAGMLPLITTQGIARAALLGREHFKLLAIFTAGESALLAVAPLCVAYLYSVSLTPLIATIFIAKFCVLIGVFCTVARVLPLKRPRQPKRRVLRALLSFGAWVTVSSVVGPILATFDRFVIGAFSGVASVPYYTVPHSIISKITLTPQALSQVLFPRFSSLAEAEQVAHLGNRSVNALNVVMTPICVAAILVVESFLSLWIDGDFASAATLVGCILIVGAWAHSLAQITVALLHGRGRPDLVAKAHLAELIPYLILLFGLVHAFGIEGAALAWTLRVIADAVLLGHFAGLLSAIYRHTWLPFALMLLALSIVAAWPADEVLRWIFSAALLGGTLAWAVLRMPEELVRYLRMVPLLRTLPFGWAVRK